ncbi:MAG: 8-oxo-dGTP diphosphatase MutT, partial [Gammaproteobacteria bacterium]
MSPVIHVAVGVIRDGQGRILLSQRRPDVHQGGLWEFPGGKLEHGERVQNALWRELEEELGIVPREAHPLIRVRHVYAECTVMLDVWEVCSFTGTPVGREGQPLKWLGTDALSPQDFPAANKAIIKAVTVPERYLITPDPGDD